MARSRDIARIVAARRQTEGSRFETVTDALEGEIRQAIADDRNGLMGHLDRDE